MTHGWGRLESRSASTSTTDGSPWSSFWRGARATLLRARRPSCASPSSLLAATLAVRAAPPNHEPRIERRQDRSLRKRAKDEIDIQNKTQSTTIQEQTRAAAGAQGPCITAITCTRTQG